MLKWFKDLFCKESPLQEETEVVSEAVDLTDEMIGEPTIYSLLMEAIKKEIVEKEEMDKFIRDLDEDYIDYLLTMKGGVGYGRFKISFIVEAPISSRTFYTFEVIDQCSDLTFKVTKVDSIVGWCREMELTRLSYTTPLSENEAQAELLYNLVKQLSGQPQDFAYKLAEHKQTFEDARTLKKLKDCQCKTH